MLASYVGQLLWPAVMASFVGQLCWPAVLASYYFARCVSQLFWWAHYDAILFLPLNWVITTLTARRLYPLPYWAALHRAALHWTTNNCTVLHRVAQSAELLCTELLLIKQLKNIVLCSPGWIRVKHHYSRVYPKTTDIFTCFDSLKNNNINITLSLTILSI